MTETKATTTTTILDSIPKIENIVVNFNIDRQCPVQYVTVYNDRAEVTRLVKHHFEADGTYELVFQGFSPSVDLTSLHVSGITSKACTILEVSYQVRPEVFDTTTELTSVDQLKDELSKAEQEREKHERELNRLNKQRSWLEGRATKLMNQDGLINSDALESMQQFMSFYHENLLKIDEASTSEGKLISEIKQREGIIQADISKRGASASVQGSKTVREVTVVVHIGAKNVDVSLNIAYLISDCLWNASYDVRVNNSDSTTPRTQLTYYGSIINRSQENWSNVQLSLSTAKPSLGGTAPKLETLKVRYYVSPINHSRDFKFNTNAMLMDDLELQLASCRRESPAFSKSSRKQLSFRGRTKLNSYDPTIEDDEETPEYVNVLQTTAEASLSSSSFAIPRRATIEADGKPHKVTIGVLDLQSTFTYTVVPKLSTNAFLKAKTINSSDKHLLPGPAAVFMDNNFITHSSIENVCVGDTFDLSLGTDAGIKVEYKTVKKLADNQGFLNKVKYETIRHDTRLNNTKSFEATINVYEQVPLSNNEKIKVKLLQPDIRNKDRQEPHTVTMNDSNNLEWKCIVKPRSEARLTVEYGIEWPANKFIEFTNA